MTITQGVGTRTGTGLDKPLFTLLAFGQVHRVRTQVDFLSHRVPTKVPRQARQRSRGRADFRGVEPMSDDTHSPYDTHKAPSQAHWSSATRNNDATEALRIVNLAGPIIYAARTRDGLIKIGVSAHMDTRLRQIGVTNDDILGFMPGDRAAELAIHRRLRAHRHHGREWYYPTPEVLAVVNEMRTAMGLEPIAA